MNGENDNGVCGQKQDYAPTDGGNVGRVMLESILKIDLCADFS